MEITIREHVPGELERVDVLILADYRKRDLRKLTDRLYALSKDEGYDFRWVGHSGQGSFDPYEYDEYLKSINERVLDTVILMVIFEVSSAGLVSEHPHLIAVSDDFLVRKLFRIADSIQKSSAKDPTVRFFKLRIFWMFEWIIRIVLNIPRIL